MARYLYVLLISLLLLCVAAPAAGARVSRGFFGVVNDSVIGASPAKLAREMRLQSSLRAGTLRQSFDWSQLEPQPGQLETRQYDRLVLAAAKRRIRILPLLLNPPAWATSTPSRRGRMFPPSDPGTMGDFARRMVERYGPNGSLWNGRDRLRKYGVRAWQVWNEPNVPQYWASGPNPAEYTRLLRAVNASIKASDSGAQVLAAGLPNSNLGIGFSEFLRGIYEAGGRDSFDTLSIHPYAVSARATVSAVRFARRQINRHGDRGAGIWVTEFGWASSGPRSRFRVGRAGQARRVSAALRGLAHRRRGLRLKGVIYYNLRDIRRPAGQGDFFGLHTGLIWRSGRAKPAFRAYRRTAGQLQR